MIDILAIDCDLRTSYGVTDKGKAFRAATPYEFVYANFAYSSGVILFEIASPVSFNRGAAGHAAMTQLAKWAIWNVAQAGEILGLLTYHWANAKFLVSPSNVWTKGYDLKTRHALCKAKQPKKDHRECEAMIFMYRHNPELWKSLPDYLASL